ncbi:MAG: DUF1254 domain-containing protein [Myxococcales bacterium]|nr:DUF1254 domain-containing protein [Myxococcales bacterium]
MTGVLEFVLHWLLPRLAVAMPLATALYYVVYKYVIPPVVWGQYRKQMKQHVLQPPDTDHGAGSSDLVYLTMTYDTAQGDIEITGEVPPAPYWQMGIYDEYVRAEPGGHLNNRTTLVQDGKWKVRITPNAHGAPNTLDADMALRGIFIYRVALPTGDVPTPTVTVVPRGG